MIGVGVCAETQVFIWLSGFHVWAGCCLCHLFRLQNRSLLTQSRMCRTSQALPLVCPLCFSSALVMWHRVQSACVCVCWILFIVKDDRWNKLTHTFIEIWKKQQQKNVLGHLLCSCACVYLCASVCILPQVSFVLTLGFILPKLCTTLKSVNPPARRQKGGLRKS